jgi:ATP-dependent DNA helicase RecQ
MEMRQALETLRRDFGRTALRPHQQRIVERVLAGVDTLGVLPTGSGKSLTYQLPAMLLPGVTLVVSPLIATMKDQVDAAPAAIRERMAYLSADHSLEQQRRTLDGVREGRIKLLYVAPERLPYRSLRSAVQQAGLSLFVVDEAHCISFWGNEFRPVYRMLARAHAEYGKPTVLALTATAPRDVVEDIVYALGRYLDIVRESVDRPTLHYAVEYLPGADARLQRAVVLCREIAGAGIVYVPARTMVGEVVAKLREAGVMAAPYHGGLAHEVREANQHAFTTGAARVMVATVAFGMGVDTRNVRFVLHIGPPTTVAAYAQETGRAGRDGQPAHCILLATPADSAALRNRVVRDVPSADALERAYGLISQGRTAGWVAVDHASLARTLSPRGDADAIAPEVVLGYLNQAQVVERSLDAPRDFVVTRRSAFGGPVDPADPAELLWQQTLALIEPEWSARGSARIDPVEACERLGVDPGRLYALLWERPEVRLESAGGHVAWYRLSGRNRGDRERLIADLLDKVRWQREQRVAQMMEYVEGAICRHVLLARAFHEPLEPCRTRCDVCAGAGGERAAATGADAMVVRDLFAELRARGWEIGRPAAARVLLDEPENRIASPLVGRLRHLGRARVDRLVDQLVGAGMLEPITSNGYPCLRLTERGARATLADFDALIGVTAPPSPPPAHWTVDPRQQPAAPKNDPPAPNPEPVAAADPVYDRLVQWRRERAARDRTEASRIATTQQLEAIARARPTSAADLRRLAGMPQGWVDRYGAEVLALLGGRG